jgi:hypothetical protein
MKGILRLFGVLALSAGLLLPGSVLGQPSSSPEEAQQIERLAGLCKLWGAIKYFHPWLAYKDIDWDAALIAAIPKVREARTRRDYQAAIQFLKPSAK